MEILTENWDKWLLVATSIVTAASIIAKITPNETDNKIIDVIKRILDVLAINPKK